MSTSSDNIKFSHKINNIGQLQTFYSSWSKSYDDDVKKCNYSGPESLIKILVDMFKINGSRIIDVGCGTGLLSDHLDTDKYQIEVDGLDFSQEMLDIAKERDYYTHLYQKNVYLIDENVERIYDFAISSGMFTHSHVEPRAIENILHLLTQYGSFMFTVRSSYCEKFNFDDYIKQLQSDKKIRNYMKIENVSYIEGEECSVFVLYK